MVIDKDNIKILLIILILGLGLGYAYINSDLNINGTAQVNSANWDVHWANIQVKNGSVSASSPTISDQTTVNYSVVLNTPGDYYEFTVDAVNGGTIDAMIDTIDSKLNGATITTLPDYLNYTVAYSDDGALQPNHQLLHNTTETYKVRIEYRTDIEVNQLPATNQTLSLQFTVTYRQATADAVAVDHSFNGHSWETIIANVKAGNTENYNVGDTKTITVGAHTNDCASYSGSGSSYVCNSSVIGEQELTVRIANKSTPDECATTGFSQSACGFVIEFVDIIDKHNYNSADASNTNGTNVGGWPASELYTYINTTIYNALPSEVKAGIINTTTVSGHGSTSGESNFTSTDKLYLLDAKEIYGDSFTNQYNTEKDSERQLDYYSSQNVTTSNYSGAIKQYNGSNSWWWLRSAHSYTSNNFYTVSYTGRWAGNSSTDAFGVSPAFRIG